MSSICIYSSFQDILETTHHNKHHFSRYCSFIQATLESRSFQKFDNSECHHIKPKCMNGTDNPSNLVYMSYREHFIAHLMLAKSFPTHSIVYALTKMNKGESVSARTFENAKALARNVKVFNKNKVMITDGTKNKFVKTDDELPSGWYYGKNKSGTCINKIKITNGEIELAIDKNESIPEGFKRGRLKKSTENTIIITDGTCEKFLQKDLPIPTGWHKGRKDAGPNNGRKWVNNGVKNVFLKPGEDIPAGFKSGKITS